MGGTETWVLTMAQHLSKEHEVGVHTKNKGFVSDLLKDFIDDEPKGYDLALINHNTCVGVDAKFKIFTSHGIGPELERPVPGCDAYVAVNEHISNKYSLDKIIKNPIDTERFKPTSEIRETPDRILNIGDAVIPNSTKPSRTMNNMPELINQHDLVVSMGRGVLEAMSCGRNVIVWDDRPYWAPRGDGYMDDPTRIKGFVAGPYAKTHINWHEELAKYKKEQGERNRQYILENHSVSKIVDEYLGIWKIATNKDI